MERKEKKGMELKGIGIFALGTLFGLEGIKLLSSKDAKSVYAHCTAGVLRAKDSVLDQVTILQENCSDIYEEAKVINEDRAKKDEEVTFEDSAKKDKQVTVEDKAPGRRRSRAANKGRAKKKAE
jgi:hypothetical protein